ncbi:hypothetical protein LPB41_20205 [Thalassospira sp. MA62]|nr:hypothetical protein [Thalassospira sp. MA62]
MTESAAKIFDPVKPLWFSHPDPDRDAKEAALRAMSDDEFRRIYAITRTTAATLRRQGDMDALYDLTRGLKTLQRIGAERGIIFRAMRTKS